MTENPSLWGVPEDIFADPRKLAALSSAVSQTLTEWRSKTKLKVCYSMIWIIVHGILTCAIDTGINCREGEYLYLDSKDSGARLSFEGGTL